MAIPLAQLVTWTNQGAVATAVATHTSIRHALQDAATSTVRHRSIEILLQGSYRNATNIYAESDVDIVVLLNDIYTRDASRLVGAQRDAELRDFTNTPDAVYGQPAFRQDVLTSLRQYYGNGLVQEGNKAIKVAAGLGRLGADIVPSAVHRLYTFYGSTILTAGMHQEIEGISFKDTAGRLVVNYPKEHIKNGQAKNEAGRTNGNYKPIVRMFKNGRRYIVEKQRIHPGLAPSYFLECLLYNVPDHLFVADRTEAMRGILAWLLVADKMAFGSGNGVTPLFGTTPEQWTIANADALIIALAKMWADWPI
jgi:hypothetical protein